MRAEYVTRKQDKEQVNVLALNGDKICLREDPQTKFDKILTLHKTDRAGLNKKDRLALIMSATEKQEAVFFAALSLTIDDEGKLADCYKINKKIKKVKARHRIYNMYNEFNIVLPEANAFITIMPLGLKITQNTEFSRPHNRPYLHEKTS